MTGIQIEGLSKRFGERLVLDDLEFTAAPGRVTGFLGPNGAGKTTTLGILLGLVTPTAGRATVGGRPYRDLAEPLRTVGVLPEGAALAAARSGRQHLQILATVAGIPLRRVEEVLRLVGLTEAAGQRAGRYSLGMRQRLGLAGALLGDPEVLVLDEPANGLDPDGIRWLRDLVRSLADEGRTVLLSSHMLSEVAQSVDDVVVIGDGQLRAQGPLKELLGQRAQLVEVRTDEPQRFLSALQRRGLDATLSGSGSLTVEATSTAPVIAAAAEEQLGVDELRYGARSLEDVFFELTAAAQDDPEEVRL